ncbi:type III-A CRISPR-associated protein Csm2 [Methylococcus geothermalis]|uniref:CRISPR system Cms protein Csm2 n=1 Tax=Methylococcus geothermalis TaxID=2681310 RepID=A0A858Q9C6_9GAMM|nr:type III-A CRISPR-associated protein Csm2 [Methylococcus geothermalis]QJD30447.1 type III-A CRISPR-associated protein Csm2 [Methylococcus geothermalis]
MDIFSFNLATNPPLCSCNTKIFPLDKPDAKLFDETAKAVAEELANPQLIKEIGQGKNKQWKVIEDKNKKANAPTQIRKFYDEVCLWAEKTQSVEIFERNLPFIKMMNAKAAYARGRELVDDKFVAWFSSCLGQITTANSEGLIRLHNFRTLFEAFVGFYKLARPK